MDYLDIYYNKKRKEDSKDAYYEEQAVEAIERSIRESEGKKPEEVLKEIRRNYPFGPLRKGRPYKIWNRLVLDKQRELGLPPRKHKK